ncbi:hypothetical protein LC087_03150 [Bacillus carboniphilus]|uniref:DoxX family protein n=1 Tax=Bacillus carboniphilus TaxID=86663 RepID=A0ABY9JUW7_9BACI|nr:hypothetical protein [Bacillus carboniphilus]WLR43209.1 hypothetical protein LC087_03150 [Bacillus carboniphilus]
MAPLIILITSFLLFYFSGIMFVPYLSDWQNSLQFAVSIMFFFAASAHWGKRRDNLINMVPPVLSKKETIVTITGVLEIALAIALFLPATRWISSIALAILLIAMFPANIRAANQKLSIGGKQTLPVFPRLMIQIVFFLSVLGAGWPI